VARTSFVRAESNGRGTRENGTGALPLSYTGVIPAAGFEPATTRVLSDVTVIFTTCQGSSVPSIARPDGRGRSFCASIHKVKGQGTSGHGKAFAHGDSNPSAKGCSARRSIRNQTPLTVELDHRCKSAAVDYMQAKARSSNYLPLGEIAATVSVPKDQSMESRSIRGLRHPAIF
jgi:hypothetical protein